MQKPLLVFKIGTSSITDENGNLNEEVVNSLAQQLANLHAKYRLVLVSSGAVGTGKKFIKNYSGKLQERKAAAAIGNPILINKYATAFAAYNIAIAQSLCERQHFSDREKFLQLRATYEELWKNGIIPIANENDVVSSRELKFSDNDELATLLAVGLNAQHLLIGTTVDGVLDTQQQLVKKIDKFDNSIMRLATTEKSAGGLGGMISKLTFARLATQMGITVHIFKARHPNGLLLALQQKIGTVAIAKSASTSTRNKWLASGSLVIGNIIIDEGAVKAVKQRKSLLAVGVVAINNSFKSGDVIEIKDTHGETIAVARVKESNKNLEKLLQQPNVIIAHADDIVLLNTD